ncbi:MAG: hypothetical protein DMG40_26535 [Acidobacteria bacterium]|nr:MAG: hypothetical protein DMG40_26535 [Acidobacteriota bacterium]
MHFRATDVERAHSDFKDRGVSIHQEPRIIASLPDRDVWLMWIRDSESNLLGIMEERRNSMTDALPRETKGVR